jgi:hypothetical protein
MLHPTRSLAALALVLTAACGGDPEEISNGDYDGPYAKEVRRAIPIIERATGKTFLTPPKLEERDRDEVRAFLERRFNEETPALTMAGIEGAYQRFGLFPEDMDLRTTLLDLLSEQVIGYYDPAEKVLYVVQGAREDYLSTTISHELVHALQDQHFALDSLQRIERDNDRQMAAQAVAEGHAVWEQLVVMTGLTNPENAMPGGWDGVRGMIRDNKNSMPLLAQAPMLLQEVLLFPYLSGAEHIRQFKQRRPGGWPFDSLPTSTEQILHPEKFFETLDEPTTITLPPLRNGATTIYENGLGEFETRLYLFEHTRNLPRAANAAAGWDGDRFALVSLPGGGEGLVWVSVWDTGVDAAEFVNAVDEALPRRYAGLRRQQTTPERRQYAGGKRSVEIVGVTIGGRSVVIVTDVPAGTPAQLIDAARLRLSPQ